MKRLLMAGIVLAVLLLPVQGVYAGDDIDDKRTAALMESMRDSDPMVRRAAAAGLGESREKLAVPVLTDVLESDPDPQVRLMALGALEMIGDHQALKAYEKALSDPDERIKQSAAKALSGFWGESAHMALINALKKEKSASVRRSVAEALGNPGVLGRYSAHKWDPTEITQAALVDALKSDKDYGVRATAARMIGKFKNALSLSTLLEAMQKDENISVRAAAAEALGTLDMPAAVPPLIEVLYFERDDYMLMSALGALKYYDDPRIADAVRSALERAVSAKVRWQAIDVIEQIRDRDSVDMLNSIARDDYEPDGVRFKAREALQVMGEM